MMPKQINLKSSKIKEEKFIQTANIETKGCFSSLSSDSLHL